MVRVELRMKGVLGVWGSVRGRFGVWLGVWLGGIMLGM